MSHSKDKITFTDVMTDVKNYITSTEELEKIEKMKI